MALCPSTPGAGIVANLIDTVDCHIRVVAQDSYRNLVGPDTAFAAALTALLTIYIALLGFQLLLGRGARISDLPVIAVKVGFILAFVTSWAAYQAVIFDVLFDGPRQLLQAMLGPLMRASDGFDGDVYGGVERAYGTLSGAAGIYGAQAPPTANILQGGPSLGSGLLWMSAIGVLLSVVGVIVAAKIVLGFLLAIGPVFVALFLFDATRGLFDGWLRATISFALAPLGANVFGAAMLMMLQPFLVVLADNAKRNLFDMGPIITIALIVAVFALVMGMGARALGAIGAGFGGGRSGSRPRALDREETREGPSHAPAHSGSGGGDSFASSSASSVINIAGIEPDRRAAAVNDALVSEAPVVAQRLGQTANRTPRPVRRRGEAP